MMDGSLLKKDVELAVEKRESTAKIPLKSHGNLAEMYGLNTLFENAATSSKKRTQIGIRDTRATSKQRYDVGKSEGRRAKSAPPAPRKRRVPCIRDKCRTDEQTMNEKPEFAYLSNDVAKEEEEEDEQKNIPFDKCAEFDGERRRRRPRGDPSRFMSIYDEPVKLRRVRRALAKPRPAKRAARGNKSSDLRYRFVHHRKILSSVAAAHLKKFKRLPFSANANYQHTCFDRHPHKINDVKEERKKLMGINK